MFDYVAVFQLLAVTRQEIARLTAERDAALRERDEEKQKFREYEHWVMTGRSEQHDGLVARIERLEAFVRVYARCPCCDDDRRCSPDCEHEINAPEQHAEMIAAREALYGKEDE
jgi:hypothetical protein